jgi:hypothetical protein
MMKVVVVVIMMMMIYLTGKQPNDDTYTRTTKFSDIISIIHLKVTKHNLPVSSRTALTADVYLADRQTDASFKSTINNSNCLSTRARTRRPGVSKKVEQDFSPL